MDCATATEMALDSLLVKIEVPMAVARNYAGAMSTIVYVVAVKTTHYLIAKLNVIISSRSSNEMQLHCRLSRTHTPNWVELEQNFRFSLLCCGWIWNGKNCISIVVVAIAVGSWRWTKMSLSTGHLTFTAWLNQERKNCLRKLFYYSPTVFRSSPHRVFFSLSLSSFRFAIQLRINVKCTSMTQAWQNAGHSTAPHRATHITQHDISLGNILQKTKRWTI